MLRYLLGIIAVFYILFASSALASGIQKLVLCGIENSVNQRWASALLKEAYRGLNIEIELITFPGKRSLVMSNTGECDGEVQRIDDMQSQFPHLLKVPTSLFFLESGVFCKDPNLEISGRESLSSSLIGIPRGIVYLERFTQGLNRIKVNNHDQLFQLLESGRVDCVLISKNYGLEYLKKHRLKAHMYTIPNVNLPLYHYLNDKHVNLVEPLNQRIIALKKQGWLEQHFEDFSQNAEGK